MKKYSIFSRMISVLLVCVMVVTIFSIVPVETKAVDIDEVMSKDNSVTGEYPLKVDGKTIYTHYNDRLKACGIPEYCFTTPNTKENPYYYGVAKGKYHYFVVTEKVSSTFSWEDDSNTTDSVYVVWTTSAEQSDITSRGEKAAGSAEINIIDCDKLVAEIRMTEKPIITIDTQVTPDVIASFETSFLGKKEPTAGEMAWGVTEFVLNVAQIVGYAYMGDYIEAGFNFLCFCEELLKKDPDPTVRLRQQKQELPQLYHKSAEGNLVKKLGTPIDDLYFMDEAGHYTKFNYELVFPEDAPLSDNNVEDRKIKMEYNLSIEVNPYSKRGTGELDYYNITEAVEVPYSYKPSRAQAEVDNSARYDIKDCNIGAVKYTGEPVGPEVKMGAMLLEEGVDYTIVASKNNKEVGTATATIKGEGLFKGTVSKTFQIEKRCIQCPEDGVVISGLYNEYQYTGEEVKPSPVLKYGNIKLEEGSDYEITYPLVGSKLGGPYLVVIEGIGNYTGEVSQRFNIVPRSLSDVDVSGLESEYVYTGSEIEPQITLKIGSKVINKMNYTVSYSNNKNVGTATITITPKNSNFTNSISKTFEIVKRTIPSENIVISNMGTATYTGSAIEPTPMVKYGSKVLAKDTDYTLDYEKNTYPGTATVIVKGNNNYSFTAEKSFIIKAPTSKVKVEGIESSYEYTGAKIMPEPSVTIDGHKLEKDTHYTVSYDGNKEIGTGKVYIDFIGDYFSGKKQKSYTFGIIPKQPTEVSVSNDASGYPKITWKAVSGADNYQVVYREPNKDWEWGKISTLSATETTFVHKDAQPLLKYKYAVRVIVDGTASLYTCTNFVSCKLTKPVIVTDTSKIYEPGTGKPVIKWGAVNNATKYIVYYSTSSNGTYEKLGTTSGLSITHKGATPGQNYYYKVQAYSDMNSDASSVSDVVKITCKDAPPTGVKYGAYSSNGYDVKVRWDAVSGATKYEIVYSADSGKSWISLGHTTYTSLIHEDAATKGYSYAVRAIKPVVSLYGFASQYAAPTGVKAATDSSTGKPVVSWNTVSSATSYQIGANSGTGYIWYNVKATETSFTHTDAQVGTKYTYAVRANMSSVYTSAAFVYDVKCQYSAPGNVRISTDQSTGKPRLQWDKVADGVGYIVTVATDKNGANAKSNTISKDQLYFDHTDAALGTLYYYWVKVNNTSIGSKSASISSICKLATPTLATAEYSTTGKPKFKWNRVSGASYYEVRHKKGTNGTWSSWTKAQEGLYYTDTDAVAGETYYYQVRAVIEGISNATSGASGDKQITCKTSAPTGVKYGAYSSNGYDVKVRWDAVSGATKYEIVYSADSGKSWISLGHTTYTSLIHEDAATKGYSYAVRAIKPVVSLYGFASQYAAPTGVKAVTDSSTGKPVVSWNTVSGATNYQIGANSGSGYKWYNVKSTETSFTHTDAKVGTKYTYAVRANMSSVHTSAAFVYDVKCQYSAPGNVRISTDQSTGKPKLQWNKVADGVGYIVTVATDKNGANANSYTINKDQLYFDHTDATLGTLYYYWVKVNNTSIGSKSASISSTYKLATPTLATAEYSTAGKPIFKWNKVSGASYYEVRHRNANNSTWSSWTKAQEWLRYTDTDAVVGEKYCYQVRAVIEGISSATSGSSATKQITCRISAPTLTVEYKGSNRAHLSWDEVVGADGYEITRYCGNNVKTNKATELYYDDLTAYTGSTYKYQIRAYEAKSNGEVIYYSSYSSTVCITPK